MAAPPIPRRGWRASRRTGTSSTRCAKGILRLERGLGAVRSIEVPGIPRSGSRRRAADPEGRGAERSRAAGRRPAGGHSGDVRRAREADVRPAGAGVSDRPDPRHHVHDGARAQRPHISEIGVPDAHHSISHHSNDPEKIESYVEDQRVPREAVLPITSRSCSATPDGDGSLLDHMMLLFGCGMSDGNGHTPRNLPIVLLGGGDQGRAVLKYPGEPSLGKPAPDAARQAGHSARESGRQQRQARSALDLNMARRGSAAVLTKYEEHWTARRSIGL